MEKTIQACCARLYESDLARMLLGDSFHPGGLELTGRLGELLELGPGTRLLDVASGEGASALYLAGRFGCEVVGIDYGGTNVERANRAAATAGLGEKVRFHRGSAESMPFGDASFHAVLCECAFCTFPDKAAAAREFARLLRPGGRIGLSDVTRKADLPNELRSLLSWAACIADALPAEEYSGYLLRAGLRVAQVEPRDEALTALVDQVQARLLGIEVLSKWKKLELPDTSFAEAREMACSARAAIQRGDLGYMILHGSKP